MSLTLTATFDEATGTVYLNATSGVDHTYGNYTLVRNDATGSAVVRTQEDLDFSSGELDVIDNEPALSGLVTYTMVAAGETAVASIIATTARTWLKFPIMPHLSVELTALSASYEGSLNPSDEVFTPLDRDDPIIVFGAFGTRSGRFEVRCDSYADAMDIIEAYRMTRIALLQVPDPAQASMYHTVRNISLRLLAPRTTQWVVAGQYLETGRPSGPVLGTLGWSYTDVAATYASYDVLQATYATYSDLTIGA